MAIYAPPRRGDPNAGPDVATRHLGVDTYYWTIEEFVTQELLPFAFVEPEDERHQYTMLIHWVTAKLLHDGDAHGDDGAWEIEGQVLRTYHELVDLVVSRLQDQIGPTGTTVAPSTPSSGDSCLLSAPWGTSSGLTSRSGSATQCAPPTPR